MENFNPYTVKISHLLLPDTITVKSNATRLVLSSGPKAGCRDLSLPLDIEFAVLKLRRIEVALC